MSDNLTFRRNSTRRKNPGLLLKLVTVIMFLSLMITGAFAYNQHRRTEMLMYQLEAERQGSMYGILKSSQILSENIRQALTCADPQAQYSHLMSARSAAESALSGLRGVPMSHLHLQETKIFLNQAADFLYSLGGTTVIEDGLQETEREQLSSLKTGAADLTDAVENLKTSLLADQYRWSEFDLTAGADQIEGDPALSGLTEIEEVLAEYPSLKYSGPFSSDVYRSTELQLNDPELSDEEMDDRALQIGRILEADEDSLRRGARVLAAVDARTFTITGDDVQYWMDLSERGGHLIWLSSDHPDRSGHVSIDEALENAGQFLHALGYDNLEPVFSQEYSNRFSLHFVSEEDGVLIYPEQIRVMVSAADGSILGLDASDYLGHVKDRDLDTPHKNLEAASKRLDRGLTFKEGRLALIETREGYEILCWQLLAENSDGLEVVIYSNVDTLREERVVHLSDSQEYIVD